MTAVDNKRLVVVSNRMTGDHPPAGGLVFALHECLSKIGGLWVGTSPEPVATPAPSLRDVPGMPYDRLEFDVTEDEHAAHYLGFSNATLWPLCHRRTDLMQSSQSNFQGYMALNRRLAGQLAAILSPSDDIWIHDYHFLPLAMELRALGVTNRIGFFLHIPFPAAGDLPALSQAAELIKWLGGYDLVGLQTQRDVFQCLSSLRDAGQSEILLDGNVRIGDRIVAIRSFPIGIDASAFAKAAHNSDALPPLGLHKTAKLLVGVDRLDYSKGLPNRFRAFGSYLARRQPDDPRSTFIQIAPSSRSDVAAYQDIRLELERAAGSVNGSYGDLDWTPLRYLRQHTPREVIAPLYRRADAALVTPLADGMNLVAKEFVAAQDPDDPGVLILSRQAGASEQMTAALLVNSFDPEDMADAIRRALAMPQAERQDRHIDLLSGVVDQDITWWTNSYLGSLRGNVASTLRSAA